jgi:hypothetical protein
MIKLLKTEDYDEEYGSRIFVSFSRDEDGNILGEPPEVCFDSGYLNDDFDEAKWTHFIDDNCNFMFSDADPKQFPERVHTLLESISINSQDYDVHEEVAAQFSKFIRRSKSQQQQIAELEEKLEKYEIAEAERVFGSVADLR